MFFRPFSRLSPFRIHETAGQRSRIFMHMHIFVFRFGATIFRVIATITRHHDREKLDLHLKGRNHPWSTRVGDNKSRRKSSKHEKVFRAESYFDKFTINYLPRGVHIPTPFSLRNFPKLPAVFFCISIFFFYRNCKADVKPSPTGYGLIGPLCTCRKGK